MGVIQRDKPGGRPKASRPACGLLSASVEIVIVPSSGVSFVASHAIQMEIDRLADPGVAVGGRLD